MVDGYSDRFSGAKFTVPRLRGGVVARVELVELLARDVLAVPLTVVSAPAGYGKTTLVSLLAARADPDRLCWVSMDADDNDPARFLTALGVALERFVPGVGASATAVLSGGMVDGASPDGLRRACIAVLNGIAAVPAQLVVVLDEWETITTPEVRAQLEFLVAQAPPNLHLVVTTRQGAPCAVARLRAHGALVEWGETQLRFTESEANALLNGVLGLDAPTSVVTTLHERTEGWPAGLRLLATSLDAGERAWLPPRGDAHVFAFLAEQVFARQPPDSQRFLVQTSVLSTMIGQACAALTGRDDADDILAALAEGGLFLTEHGMRGAVVIYRYHPLFADFLRRRLAGWPAVQRDELHRRAAAVEDDPVAVARHLVAGGEVRAAVDLIERVGPQLVRLGRAASVDDLLQSLPDTVSQDHPGLLVLAGDVAFARGDVAGARSAYEQATPRTTECAEQGAVRARLADCLYLQGDVPGSEALVDQALDGPLDPPLRMRLLLTRAQLAQIQGRTDRAEHALETAIDMAVTGDRLTVETAAAHLLPTLSFIRGGVDLLERFTTAARHVLPAEAELARLQVDGLAAVADLMRGRLDGIISNAGGVLDRYRRFGGVPSFLGYALAALRVFAAAASTSQIPLDDLLADLVQRADQLTDASFFYPNVWFLVGRAQWLRGRYGAARQALNQMSSTDQIPPGSASMIEINRLSLRGLLALTDGDHRSAEAALHEAVEEEDRLPLVDIYGSARLRLAYLHLHRGRPDTALRIVEPALLRCHQDGLAGRILFEGHIAIPVLGLAVARHTHASFATSLLRRLEDMSTPHPVPIPATGEVLTTREAQVLNLLAVGATNGEIAQHLVLGQETIKTHVTRILRKLNVRTRTAAAARAKELDLPLEPMPDDATLTGRPRQQRPGRVW
jgi:LuxR family maltose regulon positive regulatory protein